SLSRVWNDARADGLDRAQRAPQRRGQPEGDLPRAAHDRGVSVRALDQHPLLPLRLRRARGRRHGGDRLARRRGARPAPPPAAHRGGGLRAARPSLLGPVRRPHHDGDARRRPDDVEPHRPATRRRRRRRVLRRLQLPRDGVARGARLLRQGGERAVRRGRHAHRCRGPDSAQRARRPALGGAAARLRLPARGVRAAVGRGRRAAGAWRSRGRGGRGRRRAAGRLPAAHANLSGGRCDPPGATFAPQEEKAMTAIMQGVRIVEVADHTFVPAASALLADWGAEVIKIEHVERGDAMRGLASSGLAVIGKGGVHVLLEHSNRGKKSIALDLTAPDGLGILHRLVATSDVFLTNKLPSVRSRLGIEVEALRAHNPRLIYVRGTGHGERGPDADRGSYDSLAYWCRAGIAAGMKHPEDESPPAPPGPAFGDSIGAMTIAGGIMGALFHRERTGQATTVDVSLLGTGIWSHGAALALSLQLGRPWAPFGGRGAPMGNPLVATYRTRDGRFLSLCCLQPSKCWPAACEAIGQPELARDERFAEPAALLRNGAAAAQILAAAFAERTAAEWRERLAR